MTHNISNFLNGNHTWTIKSTRKLKINYRLASKLDMPPPPLKPHHQIFHDTLLNDLPTDIGTYHTNNPNTTYITISTYETNQGIGLPKTPHLATIYWNQQHIKIHNHQTGTDHNIHRADPTWLNQIHKIIQTAKHHYQTHNAPCNPSTKSSKKPYKTKATQ